MAKSVEVREMRNAETTLAIIRERGKKGLHLEDVYRQLYNPDLFLRAYGRIYKNAGAMTRGTTEETVDGMSTGKIQSIIDSLRGERYRWSPVRRTFIPKRNGKQETPRRTPPHFHAARGRLPLPSSVSPGPVDFGRSVPFA